MVRPYKHHDHIRTALLITLDGLLEMIPAENDGYGATSNWNLRWMIEHAVDCLDDFPIDKTSRWIGFIQGVLAMKGCLDVEAERDRTRPIFHRAYTNAGIKIPKTVNPSTDRD